MVEVSKQSIRTVRAAAPTLTSSIGMVLVLAAGSLTSAGRAAMGWDLSQEALATILVTVAGSLAVIVSFRSKTSLGLTTRESIALLAFVSSTMLATLFTDIFRDNVGGEKMWSWAAHALYPAGLFAVAFGWARSRMSYRALDVGAGIVGAICAVSILLEYLGVAAFEQYGTRYFGFVGDGVSWMLTFCITYFMVREKYITAVVCLLALFLTQSRGPFLPLAGAMVFLLFGSSEKRWLQVVIVAFIGALVVANSTAFSEAFLETLNRFNAFDLANSDRTATTQFSLDIFYANPIIGAGYNSHFSAYVSAGLSRGLGSGVLETATSTWAQVLSDSGISGFVPFFLYCLFVALRLNDARILRNKINRDAYTAALGLGVWAVSFMFLNQSAAWLLPASKLSPLVFVAAGIFCATFSSRRSVMLRGRAS
jgi:hypothetical protein